MRWLRTVVVRQAAGLAALALALASPAAPAAAQETESLYRAVAPLAGPGAEHRRLALAQCFEEVLIKVSGDARLAGDRRVAALARQAEALVRHAGNRDRPRELAVDFDPAKIDAALAGLGRRPWTASRPRLVVYVAVDGAAAYMLAAEGTAGAEPRAALAAAARRVAIPITLPDTAGLAAAAASVARLAAIDPALLDSAAKAAGGDLALVGRLIAGDRARGWTAEWRLAYESRLYRWQIRGASLDDAFRHGMRGAAQILSGHGRPKGSCEAPSRRSRALGRACPG